MRHVRKQNQLSADQQPKEEKAQEARLTNSTPKCRIMEGFLDLHKHVPTGPIVPEGLITPGTSRWLFNQGSAVTRLEVVEPMHDRQWGKIIGV